MLRITEPSNKHVDIALMAAAELLPALTECFCRAITSLLMSSQPV